MWTQVQVAFCNVHRVCLAVPTVVPLVGLFRLFGLILFKYCLWYASQFFNYVRIFFGLILLVPYNIYYESCQIHSITNKTNEINKAVPGLVRKVFLCLGIRLLKTM